MAVPYIFSTIPNGQTIPLQYLDANFSYVESQISSGVLTITVGSSPISNGTTGSVLYDNAGVLGEIPTSGSGSVVLGTNATLATPSVTGPLLVAYKGQESALTIATNAITIDCDVANVFYLLLNASITTVNFSNVPAAGRVFSFMLSIEADGTPRTITWPASVNWPSGAAPSLTSTAGKVDSFSFYTYDAGANWYAATFSQNA